MNTNEIVKILRCGQPIGGWCVGNCEHRENGLCELNPRRVFEQAADTIERLQKELDAAVKDIRAVLHDEADCCQICKFDGQCKPDIICHCSEAEWRGRESEET